MTEEEIKAMQKENADMKASNETLTKENGDFKDSNTKLGEDIKERDLKIEEQAKQAKEQGDNFKKLRDMTKEEKELLSEQELGILARQEKLETDQAEFQKRQGEMTAKERTARIENLANKFAKGNKDLVAQIKINLSKLDPAYLEKATTEEELTPFIDSALKMTGAGAGADPLRMAHNEGGGFGEVTKTDDYSGTKEGKDLSGMMGLSQATPEGIKAVEAGQ
jgi:hypothetical protein